MANQDQHKILLQLVSMEMPFGKYKGRLLCDVPEHYLVWYRQKGFPKGNLGVLMETLYEIKLNGLDDILYGLKKLNRK
ncbi:MAG: hypothetical protein ACJAV5_002315 [Vicingaceae bacterium]|jgi:uncharacterized protein (DUF3820 family)|tara:strand:- start:2826 stop:3059 length:234 start_codon:yes stop_codon:yes gene_type:complete